MTVSHWTSSRAGLLAAFLNVLDEDADASALTMTEGEIMAAIRNTYGSGTVSALTSSRAQLLASIVTAAGGSGNALTQSPAQLLAGLLTALGGSGNALTQSESELLASIANRPAEGGDWWMSGALLDLDFENNRYFMSGSEIAIGVALTGTINMVAGGLDGRQGTSSTAMGAAAVVALVEANLATGFSVYLNHTDSDTEDGGVPHEFFGMYDLPDPENSDNGDAVELWFKALHGALAIDDWVNTGDFNFELPNLVAGTRTKSIITLNVPMGGGNYKHNLCHQGGTVAENIRALDYATQHFDNPVQAVSIGWVASSGEKILGIVHRLAILTPRSNAQMQTLTTA